MLFMDHNASDALVAMPQNMARQPYVLTSIKEEVPVSYLLTTGKSSKLSKNRSRGSSFRWGRHTHTHTHMATFPIFVE